MNNIYVSESITQSIHNAWLIAPTPRGMVEILRQYNNPTIRLTAMKLWLTAENLIEQGDIEGPSSVLSEGQLEGLIEAMNY